MSGKTTVRVRSSADKLKRSAIQTRIDAVRATIFSRGSDPYDAHKCGVCCATLAPRSRRAYEREMEHDAHSLPKTHQAINDGIAKNLHVGAQLYVSMRGAMIADLGI